MNEFTRILQTPSGFKSLYDVQLMDELLVADRIGNVKRATVMRVEIYDTGAKRMYFDDSRTLDLFDDEVVRLNKWFRSADIYANRSHIDLNELYIDPIKLTWSETADTPNPDPYTAGAFLTHGDTNDPLLNIPISISSPFIDSLYVKYNIHPGHKVGVDKMYFVYNESERAISWDEFFLSDTNYMSMTGNHRLEFIRGAWDMGFDTIFSQIRPTMAGDRHKLMDIQQVMWSLGYKSRISPFLDHRKGHILELYADKRSYGDIFHRPDIIEFLMLQEGFSSSSIRSVDNNVRVTDITNIDVNHGVRLYVGIDDEPNAHAYLTHDYLPILIKRI